MTYHPLQLDITRFYLRIHYPYIMCVLIFKQLNSYAFLFIRYGGSFRTSNTFIKKCFKITRSRIHFCGIHYLQIGPPYLQKGSRCYYLKLGPPYLQIGSRYCYLWIGTRYLQIGSHYLETMISRQNFVIFRYRYLFQNAGSIVVNLIQGIEHFLFFLIFLSQGNGILSHYLKI